MNHVVNFCTSFHHFVHYCSIVTNWMQLYSDYFSINFTLSRSLSLFISLSLSLSLSLKLALLWNLPVVFNHFNHDLLCIQTHPNLSLKEGKKSCKVIFIFPAISLQIILDNFIACLADSPPVSLAKVITWKVSFRVWLAFDHYCPSWTTWALR